MTDLTDRQREILEFIYEFVRLYNYTPSVAEITSGCGLSSTSLTARHLKTLEKLGYIRRFPKVARGIVLTDKARALWSSKTPQ